MLLLLPEGKKERDEWLTHASFNRGTLPETLKKQPLASVGVAS